MQKFIIGNEFLKKTYAKHIAQLSSLPLDEKSVSSFIRGVIQAKDEMVREIVEYTKEVSQLIFSGLNISFVSEQIFFSHFHSKILQVIDRIEKEKNEKFNRKIREIQKMKTEEVYSFLDIKREFRIENPESQSYHQAVQ